MSNKDQSHFTLEQRVLLLKYIEQKKSLREIGRILDKNASSISRELFRNRYSVPAYGTDKSLCAHTYTCRQGSSCYSSCPDYSLHVCPRLAKAPWICAGCDSSRHCHFHKFKYNPEMAHKQYQKKLIHSRELLALRDNDSLHLNQLLVPLVHTRKQSLAHVYATHRAEIGISLSTLYRYIDKGYLEVRNIDLPRRVRYRVRTRTPKVSKPTKIRENRTYLDFQTFLEKHPELPVFEMDTVIGKRECTEAVLLTILLRKSNFMIAYLLMKKSAQRVVAIFDALEKQLGRRSFSHLFSIGITDNGSEFYAVDALEKQKKTKKRMHVFYCDARASQQKGKIEKNHEHIRSYIPQGNSFNHLTQEDVNTMMNHINSIKRVSLGNQCPFECLSPKEKSAIKKLGYEQIPADLVNITPSIFKK